MREIGSCCKFCRQKLGLKEREDSILLVCLNQRCRNYWSNQGCEIIMMLK